MTIHPLDHSVAVELDLESSHEACDLLHRADEAVDAVFLMMVTWPLST